MSLANYGDFRDHASKSQLRRRVDHPLLPYMLLQSIAPSRLYQQQDATGRDGSDGTSGSCLAMTDWFELFAEVETMSLWLDSEHS